MEKARPYNNRHVVTTCKDCTDRYLGCHDQCKKYQTALKDRKELYQEIKKKRNREKEIQGYFRTATKRMQKTQKTNFKDKY